MPAPNYPDAERLTLVEDFHGTAVADPYRWLEDPSDPRTTAWVDTQGQLMADERSGWATHDHFADRVTELLGAGTISPP